jgi:ribosomal-protein-alanine N-acetyltransferase
MLTIRALRQEDLPALIEMERAAPTAAHWKESEYIALLAIEAAPLRKTFVAEKDGQPVGFVVARVVVMDWELENVVVHAGSQRQGIGCLLLARLIQEAQACKAQAILLEVRSRNAVAKSLYTKSGFSVAGGRRGYYRNPEDDAVLYKLKLSKTEGNV